MSSGVSAMVKLGSSRGSSARGSLSMPPIISPPRAGPVSGVRGFWTATGCNGSGFSISAGVGRSLAEWIIGGEPPFDLSLLDPNRFGPAPLDDDELIAAGLWRYANYYTPQPVG